MISIDINSAPVSQALTDLLQVLSDLSPVMAEIAEMLVISAKERFAAGTAPDGTSWAPKSAATLASYRARKSSYIDTRPLFGPNNELNNKIFPDSGTDFAEVGSARVYAAMMQFGGTKAAFPHLWGDIPARPFLGLSEADEQNILDEISDWISRAITP